MHMGEKNTNVLVISNIMILNIPYTSDNDNDIENAEGQTRY